MTNKRHIKPSDFTEPLNAFPIVSQKDVDKAALGLENTPDAEIVRAAIKRIAERKGLTVPESWCKDA